MSKRSRWMISFGGLMLLLISLSRVGVVRAVFDEPHDALVMYRVATEILPTTPGGRFYLDLLIKHEREIVETVEAHPEHLETLMHTTHLFVPGFEALLDGKGDTVYITSEQVSGLESALDWFASVGSVALQKDIRQERQRLLLPRFVGMNMNEAWDTINSSWTPAMEVQLPFMGPQEMTPGETILIKDTAFVPHSGWKWAYYNIDGIYLEYSSSFCFEIYKADDHRSAINFIPFLNLPFDQHTPVVSVQIVKNIPLDENAKNPTILFDEENVVWKSNIHNPDFDGVEFVVKFPNTPQMIAAAVLYSEKDQLAVGLQTQMRETNTSSDTDYFVLLNEKYEYFQHLIEQMRLELQ